MRAKSVLFGGRGSFTLPTVQESYAAYIDCNYINTSTQTVDITYVFRPGMDLNIGKLSRLVKLQLALQYCIYVLILWMYLAVICMAGTAW